MGLTKSRRSLLARAFASLGRPTPPNHVQLVRDYVRAAVDGGPPRPQVRLQAVPRPVKTRSFPLNDKLFETSGESNPRRTRPQTRRLHPQRQKPGGTDAIPARRSIRGSASLDSSTGRGGVIASMDRVHPQPTTRRLARYCVSLKCKTSTSSSRSVQKPPMSIEELLSVLFISRKTIPDRHARGGSSPLDDLTACARASACAGCGMLRLSSRGLVALGGFIDLVPSKTANAVLLCRGLGAGHAQYAAQLFTRVTPECASSSRADQNKKLIDGAQFDI